MKILIEDIVKNFLKEIRTETDRGTAIVGAAILDDLLAEMLKKRFVNNPKVADSLLNSHGAIGTFASRINLVHMLGLSRPDQFHDLDIVRKIRNQFAHTHQPVSFSDQSVNDLCKNFRQIKLLNEKREEMPDELRKLVKVDFESSRELFIAHVVHLFAGLVLKAQSVSHIEENSIVIKEKSTDIF